MSKYILQIKDLSVEVGSKRILNKVNLNIEEHSTMVLFGPNGSGKSTLIKAIMGFGGYRIVEGDIIFEGRSIKDLPIEERAHLGIGVMFQHPPKIRGVRLDQIANFLTKDSEHIRSLSKHLNLTHILTRDLNLDLSGGEMKRSELFQVILQKPRVLFLDEPESGVDIENISIMGRILDAFLKETRPSCLAITHTGYILDYIDAKMGCVMMEGHLYCSGHPREIFESIKKFGYEKCKECRYEI
jgi:Fe-S cluster assembly ATP-binding protein